MKIKFYLPALIFVLCLFPVTCLAANSPKTTTENPAVSLEEAAASSDKKDENAGEEETPQVSQTTKAWDVIWMGQKEMVNAISGSALKLSEKFSQQTHNLSEQLKPYEDEGNRLLVFVNTFKSYPNGLESVRRRVEVTLREMHEVLKPINEARAEALDLLGRINHMAESVPYEDDKSKLSPEMNEYIQEITRTRFRLTAILSQYDSILPSLTLLRKLEETNTSIKAELPGLWKDYYLQSPVAWLNPDTWQNIIKNFFYVWQAVILRLPVEFPYSVPQWSNSILRFLISLVFMSALTLIFKRNFVHEDSPKPLRSIFRSCAPWFIVGFSFLAAALAPNGDFFRLFLVIGSLCVIYGQIYLAWNLRLQQFQITETSKAPLVFLLPPAIAIYVIFYLPVSNAVTLVCWLVVLLSCLFWRKKPKNKLDNSMQLEIGVINCYSTVLWICLFLVVSGLQIYSMLLYLCYISLSLALEVSFGGMSLVTRINERLPQEGAHAAIVRLLVALAAPFVIVLAVAGMCLWVAMLPGGVYLIREYALRGVTIGATQFNIIQVLLIISLFYLTRTVVSMGARFLTKLPKQGGHFDATLITPLQTALTYIAWALFGLFVLHSLGMALSNLAMIAGGLSVGIGFGMQTIVNNFVSGLILIFSRTLQVGDVIEVGGTTGRVRKISIRATMVETYDNAVIYVPNSEFIGGRLLNWTSFSRSIRCIVQVGIAYGSNVEEAKQLLLEIASKHVNVLKYPAPSVIFANFGDSALDIRLRFWVKDYEMGVGACSDIRAAINLAFAEKNIEIAFPQLDVHIKDGPENCPAPKSAQRPAPTRLIRKKSMPTSRPKFIPGKKKEG